jgi:hypothetical protein
VDFGLLPLLVFEFGYTTTEMVAVCLGAGGELQDRNVLGSKWGCRTAQCNVRVCQIGCTSILPSTQNCVGVLCWEGDTKRERERERERVCV